MMYRRVFSFFLFSPFFLLWLSCNGSPAVPGESGFGWDEPEVVFEQAEQAGQTEPVGEEPVPPAVFPGVTFIPGEFPSFEVPAGVGLVTRERDDPAFSLDEKDRLSFTESFRTAYIDNLLRGVPLAGVLGADLVHGWPAGAPLSWVQNWRGPAGAPNSWRLPRLVLAVLGIREEAAPGRVFIVRGKVLDHYGKSAGIDGANGSMGYGSPRGYEFFLEGKIAQRFDFGLITIDREGKGAFIPEVPPSLKYDLPAETGIFSGGIPSEAAENVRTAFWEAAKMALDRGAGTMIPDGMGGYISFTETPADFFGGEALKGLYVQSFNGGTVLLILPDSAKLPSYPRFVAVPYLDVLLASETLSVSGGENLEPLDVRFSGDGGFFRPFMNGLARYGIPLSDPVPFEDENGQWLEIQRFSRGTLARPYDAEADNQDPNEKL